MNQSERRKWTITGFVIAALAALGIGIASAADKKKTSEPLKPKTTHPGDPYKGPGPRLPGGKTYGGGGTGKKSLVDQPPDVAADDLWISPECDVVIVGDLWFPEVAVPAIEAWAADGVPAMDPLGGLTWDPSLSPERVVRELLGPYAPLCVDTWPWKDVLMQEHPEPQQDDFPDDAQGYEAYLAEYVSWSAWIENRQKDARMDRPQFGDLIGDLYGVVLQIAGDSES